MSENSRIHADYAPWVQWQVFWLAVGWRTVFPTKLSVTRVFAPQRTAHSSGTVRDSHPVPFSSCPSHEPIAVQSYKKRWNNRVAKKIYYGPTLHTSQTKTYLSRKQKQVFHANRNISFTKTETYLSRKDTRLGDSKTMRQRGMFSKTHRPYMRETDALIPQISPKTTKRKNRKNARQGQ